MLGWSGGIDRKVDRRPMQSGCGMRWTGSLLRQHRHLRLVLWEGKSVLPTEQSDVTNGPTNLSFSPHVNLPPCTGDASESAAVRALKSQPDSILIRVSETEMDAFHFKCSAKEK